MNAQPPPPGDQHPAPYPYGQQPPPATPMPPPKRSRAWLWILLGAAGLAVLCCGVIALNLVNSDDDKGSNGGQGGQAETPQPTNPGIGDPVRDGKFEFVVNEVQCGVERVGTPDLGQAAQGQFCLVTLSVKNVGDEPQTFQESDQEGFGTNGSEYSTDSSASIYANEANSQVWITEINPGNQITGVIVYDLPDGVELAKLELHDSMFSSGVTVDLK